ncbi:MAG TPA: oligoribonuclease [Candidatus Saccharimonadales bacterium]|nr:oligoribonuclease [Candidatus Saccharimonadales bacterium]
MVEVLNKHATEHLLWLDLEMTGLDPTRDRILEVAAIVTDWDFNEVARFESGVGQDNAEITQLLDANPFYVKMKDNKRVLLEQSAASPAETAVESMLVDFIRSNCDTHRPVILAGNSIHMDRQFINQYWPRVNQLLHYRMLDVSAWKLVFEAKFGTKVLKKETHRALGDIEESIAELRKYIDRIN